jgi:hypothetical protein
MATRDRESIKRSTVGWVPATVLCADDVEPGRREHNRLDSGAGAPLAWARLYRAAALRTERADTSQPAAHPIHRRSASAR